MPASVEVIRGNIAQPFVIAAVVVIFDEASNGFFQFTGHLMRHQIDFSFKGTMVPLDLAIGLRMEGRGSDVSYPHHSQVFVELPGNIACPIIRQQHLICTSQNL